MSPISDALTMDEQLHTPLSSHLSVHLILVLITGLVLSACQNLPQNPHTGDSLYVNQMLTQHYPSTEQYSHHKKPNNIQSDISESILTSDIHQDNSTVVTQPNPILVEDNNQYKTLQSAIADQIQRHPNQSGYATIATGSNAFSARSLLIDMATTSIDVQYYIWHNDQAGQLLLQDLWQAADRGVLIRFLLDDFNSNVGLDKHLLALAEHPNIAVRLVNPLPHRKYQTLNFLTEMPRINRRMHNKSMTFDRQLSVIGGRNIGDEYMSNSKGYNFADLDVMLIGPVINDIGLSFESYWQSPMAYDIQTLVKPKNSQTTDAKSPNDSSIPNIGNHFVASLEKITSNNNNDLADSLRQYEQSVKQSLVGSDLLNERIPFKWAEMVFLADNVDKLTKTEAPNTNLVYQLRHLLGTPIEDLAIISSYFVPTSDGVTALIKLAQQGVNIQILTNSFNATDVTAVHSGYAPWRKALISAGIDLYELKATATEEDRENRLWRARSQSSTSLHAKAFAVDNEHVFIGSYNIDPRSAHINTELGVVINDTDLAYELKTALSDTLMTQAYKVVLADDGSLEWHTIEDNKFMVYHQEPDVDLYDKVWLKIMGWLPIDWML